jgi:hypothetical protein
MRPSGSPKTTLSASSSYANLAAAGGGGGSGGSGGGESGGGGGFPAASSRKRRFMWTAALHERFIAAVFDIGLRTCTPLSVFDAMGEGAEDGGDGGVRGADLAPEHVKSHLQKYRNNHRLGRTAFLRGFAEAQTAARVRATAGGGPPRPWQYCTYPAVPPSGAGAGEGAAAGGGARRESVASAASGGSGGGGEEGGRAGAKRKRGGAGAEEGGGGGGGPPSGSASPAPVAAAGAGAMPAGETAVAAALPPPPSCARCERWAMLMELGVGLPTSEAEASAAREARDTFVRDTLRGAGGGRGESGGSAARARASSGSGRAMRRGSRDFSRGERGGDGAAASAAAGAVATADGYEAASIKPDEGFSAMDSGVLAAATRAQAPIAPVGAMAGGDDHHDADMGGLPSYIHGLVDSPVITGMPRLPAAAAGVGGGVGATGGGGGAHHEQGWIARHPHAHPHHNSLPPSPDIMGQHGAPPAGEAPGGFSLY